MAPLTQTAFDDYSLASVWPRPVFLLAIGSVAFLLFILRRHLTSRRYLKYVNIAACNADDETPLSELSPPLRSVYHHQHGLEANKSSSVLAVGAATRQFVVQPLIKPAEPAPNKRYSCPYPESLDDEWNTVQEPPQYSELIHDSVETFPELDDEGGEMTDMYWRRRTLIYA